MGTSASKRHAEVENLSIFGTTFRLSPGLLHVYAADFMDAAESAPAATFSPARSYLVCHALELALKAFLSLKGQCLLDLANNFGHRLDKLLAFAEQNGLSSAVKLDQGQLSEIRRASDYYHEKVFEYPALAEACVQYPRDPDAAALLKAARQLIDALRDPCLSAG